MTLRYPELGCLAKLPAGTVLDGEIIVLRSGVPDFASVLRRDLQQSARKQPDSAAPLTRRRFHHELSHFGGCLGGFAARVFIVHILTPIAIN